MKRTFSYILMGCIVATASAADFSKLKAQAAPATIAPQAAETTEINFTSNLAAIYDATTYEPLADYYSIVSTSNSASYDSNLGQVTAKDCWVMSLDLVNDPSTSHTLAAGTYKAIGDPYPDMPAAFSAISDYSMVQYYNSEGVVTIEGIVENDVKVEVTDNIYTVTTSVKASDGKTYNVTYNGRLPYIDPSQKNFAYRQLNEDRKNINFIDGMAFYYGSFQSAKAGSMMIQLYDKPFDHETGRMDDNTQMICINIIGRLFSDEKKITIDPGVYHITKNSVERGIACAARELDYMGTTIILGTYLQDRNETKYGSTDRSAYGYLESGDILIEAVSGGYHISLENGRTNLGYEITFDYTGAVSPIINSSGEQTETFLSTIEDDVKLALDDLPVAHLWNGGVVNNCRTFVLDIGSPSGRDTERDNGGDIMRIEFVCENGVQQPTIGNYTVMEEVYDTYYAPGTLGQTKWVQASTGGTDISGTRYMHFIENRYYVMDHYAFINVGTVGLTISNEESPDSNKPMYDVDINLMSDNGYYVTGKWHGQVELMYDPDSVSAIGTIGTDGSEARIASLGGGLYQAVNFAGTVQVYNVSGVLCGNYDAASVIDLSAMPNGLYIFKAGKTTFKISK